MQPITITPKTTFDDQMPEGRTVTVSKVCRLFGVLSLGVLGSSAGIVLSAPSAGASPILELIGGDPIVSAPVAAHTSGMLTASGGNGIYHFSATGLPPGLALRKNVVSGVPTTAGDYSVTFTVTDTEKPPQSASATASVTITPGQPTLTLKAPTKVKYGANITLVATLKGTLKAQPDTGTVTFSTGDTPITCASTVTKGTTTACTFNSDVLGGVGTYSIEANAAADVNYDAASAAGQVSVYK